MGADATLVNAAFREAKSRAGATGDTPGVIDQSALYQSTIDQSRQALGLITGAMKNLDDKMEKNKLGAEQQLKGFETLKKNGLRKLYELQEPLPDEIIFAIEEEVKRLQGEYEKVNTYGKKDNSENEKARVKLEASLQRIINEAITTRGGFMTLLDGLDSLNVDQISRNSQNINPMRQVLEWVVDGKGSVPVFFHPETGRLTYTASNYNDDGAGNLSGEPVYMNVSDMQKYLPRKNTANETASNEWFDAASTAGINGGIDGEYNVDSSISEIVGHGSIKTKEDFQSAMDQKHPKEKLSFTRSLTSNANIPLSIINLQYPTKWGAEKGLNHPDDSHSGMYFIAKTLDTDKDGVLEEHEIEGASEEDWERAEMYSNEGDNTKVNFLYRLQQDAESMIDVITNTENKLYSESTSKNLYAQWVTDINKREHDKKIAINIATAEALELKTTRTEQLISAEDFRRKQLKLKQEEELEIAKYRDYMEVPDVGTPGSFIKVSPSNQQKTYKNIQNKTPNFQAAQGYYARLEGGKYLRYDTFADYKKDFDDDGILSSSEATWKKTFGKDSKWGANRNIDETRLIELEAATAGVEKAKKR